MSRAQAFLLKDELLPKLFGTFARRYADRPGGYTRIHRYGNRFGDNAPNAILELVDNPRDLRYEMTSRTVGWEMLKEELRRKDPIDIIQTGVKGIDTAVQSEKSRKFGEKGLLRPKTRWNLQKVLKFRGPEAIKDFTQKAEEHAVRPSSYVYLYSAHHSQDNVLASRVASDALHDVREAKAGQMLPGEVRGAKQLANGALGVQKPSPTESHILSVKRMFSRPTTEPAPI